MAKIVGGGRILQIKEDFGEERRGAWRQTTVDVQRPWAVKPETGK